MDGLTAAYFVSFVAGAGFAVVSWLLGAIHGHGDGGGDGDGGGHEGGVEGAEADADADLDLGGKAGLLHGAPGVSHGHAVALARGPGAALAHGHGRAEAGLSLLLAAPSGLAAAYLVGGLVQWLRRGTHYKEATSLGGSLATVLAPVSDARLGEIMYVNDGARATLPARGAKDAVLPPGTEVVILDVKDGIARVAAAAELLGLEAPAAAPERDHDGAATTPRPQPHGEKERGK
jgi:hypothetical protein